MGDDFDSDANFEKRLQDDFEKDDPVTPMLMIKRCKQTTFQAFDEFTENQPLITASSKGKNKTASYVVFVARYTITSIHLKCQNDKTSELVEMSNYKKSISKKFKVVKPAPNKGGSTHCNYYFEVHLTSIFEPHINLCSEYGPFHLDPKPKKKPNNRSKKRKTTSTSPNAKKRKTKD